MEITFEDIKNKEIINIYDGKKLGHASDLTFDKQTSRVLGISVPGEKRLFRKVEQIFIPIENIKKIGEDVCLVKIAPEGEISRENEQKQTQASRTPREVYARYKRVALKEK